MSGCCEPKSWGLSEEPVVAIEATKLKAKSDLRPAVMVSSFLSVVGMGSIPLRLLAVTRYDTLSAGLASKAQPRRVILACRLTFSQLPCLVAGRGARAARAERTGRPGLTLSPKVADMGRESNGR